MPDQQQTAEESVARFLSRDTTARALGLTVSQVAPGVVTAHMTIRPEMLNGHGSAHGAALFAVADIAFAMACNSHGYAAVGRSCGIEYLAPAFEGQVVTARAVERAVVGRDGIYDVSVTCEQDARLLAEMRAHSRQVAAPPTGQG